MLVQYSSRSFLVKKSSGGVRFVTAFNNVSTLVSPTKTTYCNDVLQKLSSWKYMVQTDLTKSYYQIPVTKSSIPFLGTVTPLKVLESIYGQEWDAKFIGVQELISRVFGDYLQGGFTIIIADDLHICGDTINELLSNWTRIVKRLEYNNLKLSATKTVICPKRTTVLGWVWDSGTLSIGPYKVASIATLDPPVTCTGMRSFLSAFNILSFSTSCFNV